jgi:phospholipid/cholesterol/gamma-HCH transport system substrate-binding protein
MKTRDVELVVGLALLVVIGILVYISLHLGQVNLGANGYSVYAEFPTAGGLQSGAVVELAGVEVGRVAAVNLTKDYRAQVTLVVHDSISLREDARAAIKSKGLIGERYVEITPGKASGQLPPGGQIRETEAPVDIQELITKFIFGDVESKGTEDKLQ